VARAPADRWNAREPVPGSDVRLARVLRAVRLVRPIRPRPAQVSKLRSESMFYSASWLTSWFFGKRPRYPLKGQHPCQETAREHWHFRDSRELVAGLTSSLQNSHVKKWLRVRLEAHTRARPANARHYALSVTSSATGQVRKRSAARNEPFSSGF